MGLVAYYTVMSAVIAGLLWLVNRAGQKEIGQLKGLVGKGIARVYPSGLFFQVEENHVLVLRNIWNSYPGKPPSDADIDKDLPIFQWNGAGGGQTEELVPKQAIAPEDRDQFSTMTRDEKKQFLAVSIAPFRDAAIFLRNSQSGRKRIWKRNASSRAEYLGDLQQKSKKKRREHEPRGYYEKREGFRMWWPGVLHDIVAVVSLAPQNVDGVEVRVTTKDNQVVTIKFRYLSAVAHAVKHVLRVLASSGRPAQSLRLPQEQKEVRVEFEKSAIVVLMNQFSARRTAEALTSVGGRELEEFGITLAQSFDIRYAEYGTRLPRLGIQRIEPPQEIQDRKALAGSYKVANASAVDEAQRFKTIIKETGADPTAVVQSTNLKDLAQNIMGGAVRLFESAVFVAQGRTSKKRSKEKEEGKEK